MSIIDELRKATKEKHNQLDKLGPLSNINSSDVGLKDYELYLQLFHGIHYYLEPSISNKFDKEFGFEPRLPLLQKELDKLDLTNKVLMPQKPIHLESDEVLGSLYVLEGSKLGGKMIVKNLRENLPLPHEHYCFLDSPSRYSWKDTVEFIKKQSEGKMHETVSGAVKAFDFILSYVDQFYEKESSQNK